MTTFNDGYIAGWRSVYGEASSPTSFPSYSIPSGGTAWEYGDLYADRIETARLRAGNMFADPLIAADFGTCNGLLQKL